MRIMEPMTLDLVLRKDREKNHCIRKAKRLGRI